MRGPSACLWTLLLALLAGCADRPAATAPEAETGPWSASFQANLTLSWPRSGEAVTGDGSACVALGTGRTVWFYNVTATLEWTPASQDARRLLFAIENQAGTELDQAEGEGPLTVEVDRVRVPARTHLSLYAVPQDRGTAVVLHQPLVLRIQLEYEGPSPPQLGPLVECTL